MTDRQLERAAVQGAAAGYYIFALRPRTKIPYKGSRGWHDATRDEATILRLWDRVSLSNIGVACGPSGMFALDIDAKSGADPDEVIAQLGLDGHPATILTGVAPAPSEAYPDSLEGVRGPQLWFRGKLPTGATTIPGVEIRGTGGYVLLPPSVHPSGVAYEGTVPPVSDLPPDPGLARILPPEAASERTGPKNPPEDDEPITTPGRHEGLLNWARSRLTAKGILGTVALDAMRGHNQAYCRPPLPDREVVRLWRHLEGSRIAESERRLAEWEAGSAGGAADPQDDPRDPPARPERLVDMVEAFRTANDPIPWRCKPLLADGYVTVLSGKPGVDKSWLALALCATVGGGGGELAGMPCTAGGALYVGAENGARLDARRLTMLGADAAAVHVADGFGMRIPKDIRELRELIVYTCAKLVWLDSLRRLAPEARENDSDYLAPIFAALAELSRELQVAIGVIVHRSVKPGASDFRGSSAIQDQADALWVLEKVIGDPERHSRRRLRCEKLRFERDPGAHWIHRTIVAGFYTLTEATAYVSEGGEESEPEVAAHEALADRIRALASQAEFNGEGWTKKRLAAAVNSDARSGTFQRALGLLLTAEEWGATGSTSDRRYRPLSLRHLDRPLRDGASGASEDDRMFDPDSEAK
jgi:hypothetical protein